MKFRKVQTLAGLVEGIPCGNPTYTVFKGITYAQLEQVYDRKGQ